MATPADKPETTPVVMPAVAMAVLLLLHMPPEGASLSEINEPAQTDDAPEIAPGNGSTVIKKVATQPVGSVYLIVVTPVDTPVTIPLPDPIVATPVLLLDHVPPGEPSVSVKGNPVHAIGEPEMASGSGLTVTVIMAKQPVTGFV